jgi:hypothetical protein
MKRATILVGLPQLVTLMGALFGRAYGFLPTISSRRRVWRSASPAWTSDEPLGLSAMQDCDNTAGPTIDSSNSRRRRILQSTLATVVFSTMATTTLPLVALASLLEEFGTDPKSIQSRKPPPAAAVEATPAKSVAIDPTLRGCK